MAGSEYYDHTTYPAQGAPGSSAALRAELDAIEAGFGKLPNLSGNGGKIVIIKIDASGLEVVEATGTGNIVRSTDPTFTLTDLTTNNATTLQHGWLRKLSGNASEFLNGAGNWVSGAGQQTKRRVRTSNTILSSADNSYLIDITAGTFTQTFTAAATLADGWYCWLRNAGTGDITLDPNGGELIDGLASYVMYPGEVRLIQCSGTAFTSFVVNPFYKVWTTSGTWVKPPGYLCLGMEAWSGGASGQRTNNATVVSIGGTGGGGFPRTFPMSELAATEIVIIGAGGLPVTTVAAGNPGGDTSFNSLLIKGASLIAGGSVTDGFGNAVRSNGQGLGFEAASINGVSSWSTVWGGSSTASNGSQDAGHSVGGGAAGGSLTATAVVRAPGLSVFGGDGGAAVSAGNGVDGAAPGGGGGATQTGAQSGAGGRGEIRMWGIA